MKWTAWLRRRKWERGMHSEMRFHVEAQIRDYLRQGISLEEAERLAGLEFGPFALAQDECRDQLPLAWLDHLRRDIRTALRSLRRSPGFAVAAILTLALGIGANTAIFSVVNTFLLRPLPFPDPERLVQVFEHSVVSSQPLMSPSPGIFLDWRKQAQSFENLSAIVLSALTFTSDAADATPERIFACTCSGNLFETLGVRPFLGRSFLPQEDVFQGPHVAVISYNFWQAKFGGSADAIGKRFRADGTEYELVGVLPKGFMYPNRIVDIWRPLLTNVPPAQQIRHDVHYIRVVGRVRREVPVTQAAAELDAISAQFKSANPGVAAGTGAAAMSLHRALTGDARTPLIVLLAAVGCVLLIACVNIANLILTRAVGKAREIAIRSALGAGRGRIIQQLVIESLLLGLAGGTAGALLGISLTGVLAAHAPGAAWLIPEGNLPVDNRVFAFALAAAVLTGVLVGLFPAIRVSRVDLAEQLKDTGRSATSARSHGRLRNILVAAEVTLSMILLVSSGLLLHSFFRLYQVQPGVRVDHTLTMNVAMPPTAIAEPERRAALWNDLRERLEQLPGIAHAGFASCAPLTGECNTLFYYVEGRPFVSGKFLIANERVIDPDFFAAAGIPLVRGRTFTRQDGVGSDPNKPRLGSIVISDTMAKAAFPGEDPIGKRIFFDYEVQRGRIQNMPVPRYEIVGIVGDVRASISQEPAPAMYRPLLDSGNPAVSLLLHTQGDSQAAVNTVRNEIRKFNSSLAVSRIQTMEEIIGTSTADRQFSMFLFLTFAGLALLLATIGLYGLVSYAVSQRKAEIGIRMALGATARDVRTLVVLDGLKPAIAGLILGAIAAVFATPILRTQLFGITPGDPLTFSSVALLLLAVAGVACYLPAIRATRLDPTVALRAE